MRRLIAIAALGTNLLTVSPGSTVQGGVFGGGGSANTLSMSDVQGLASKDNAPDIPHLQHTSITPPFHWRCRIARFVMGDHLVDDREQLVWNGEVERLGGGYGHRPGGQNLHWPKRFRPALRQDHAIGEANQCPSCWPAVRGPPPRTRACWKGGRSCQFLA